MAAVVEGVSPLSGVAGDTVTLTGVGFADVIGVVFCMGNPNWPPTFMQNTAVFTVVDDSTVTVVVPACPGTPPYNLGSVWIDVWTSDGGDSGESDAPLFNYL